MNLKRSQPLSHFSKAENLVLDNKLSAPEKSLDNDVLMVTRIFEIFMDKINTVLSMKTFIYYKFLVQGYLITKSNYHDLWF